MAFTTRIRTRTHYQRVEYTPEQAEKMAAARVAFFQDCPFFCSFFYDQLEEYPTYDVLTAATDGRRVFINPGYVCALRVPEICFVYAHETYHAVWRHMVRARYYRQNGNKIENMEFSMKFFNECADYVINADLVELKIGMMNPNWLFDPDVKGTDLVEDIYKRYYRRPPPPPPGGGGNQPPNNTGTNGNGGDGGRPSNQPPKTWGRGSQPDKTAQANGGAFDQLFEPAEDPATGAEDIADEQTFKEAIARAAANAKAIGKMPGLLQRVVDQILEPQVNWREHVRMLITGKLGNNRETWDTPNRRRIVLNPLIYMPGKKGHGCELVACWIDNSGSVSQEEYNAFYTEIGAIFQDVRPKHLFVGWCDAAVNRVEWCRSLEEVWDYAYKPHEGGGGGTSFIPPFEYMKEHGINPETCVYLTDMMGPFPRTAPPYPVVWCASTDKKAPWGETVKIKA